MTHDRLATLLREDVTATEPQWALDAMAPVRLGRRRLRTRRLRAAGVTAVLVAVAAAAVPLATAGDHAAAPATHGSAADRVRELLEPSTGDLATPTVAVGPTGTTFAFGSRQDGLWHGYRVTSDVDMSLADPAEHCREAMEERGYVSCSVVRGPAGTAAVVQVLLVVPVGEVPADNAELGPVGDNTYARVPISGLSSVDPRDRIFRREALVATSTGTVSVDEQVSAAQPPSPTAYVVSVGALLEVAGELAARPELFEAH